MERQISNELLDSVASDSSTLVVMIRVAPKDAAAFGLTNCSDDVEFDELTYRAAPMDVTRIESGLGFAVDNLEARGAYEDDFLTERDVLGGVYDDAEYELFLVDYEHIEHGKMILQSGTLGDFQSLHPEWRVELRSLAQMLSQQVGDITSPDCRADFCDGACKIDVTGTHPRLNIPYRYAGVVVTSVINRFTFTAAPVAGFPAALPTKYFRNGSLLWTDGNNTPQRSEVKEHTLAAGVHTFVLQEPTRTAFAIGDELRVDKGCDKTADACFDVDNFVNRQAEDYLIGLSELIGRAGS